MKLATLGILAVAAIACGGDDEHVPVDAAAADAAVDAPTDAAALDAPALDADTDGTPADAAVDAPPGLNGCTPQNAVNLTGPGANRTIQFGGSLGLIYDPPCIRVAAGQSVTWSGDLTEHPLRGGTVVNGVTTVDPQSPVPPTDSGTTVTVPFPNSGMYGYFCNIHGSIGMNGAVLVEP